MSRDREDEDGGRAAERPPAVSRNREGLRSVSLLSQEVSPARSNGGEDRRNGPMSRISMDRRVISRIARLTRALSPLAGLATLWSGCALPGASGPAAAPVPTPRAAPAEVAVATAVAPAPHYAALFRAGAKWTYRVKRLVQMQDNPDPAADPSGKTERSEEVTCLVAELSSFPGGVVSRVECSEALGVQGREMVSGFWAATGQGLFRVDGVPEAGARPSLDPAGMTIAAAPVEREEKTGTDDAGTRRAVWKNQDSWCVVDSSWGVHEVSAELCFGPAGVTSGEAGWAGGSVHEVTFELLR